MEQLYINKGEKVIYNNKECIITRIIDIQTVSIEEVETNVVHTLNVSKLQSAKDFDSLDYDLNGLSKKQWDKATHRYNVIKPLLNDRRNLKLVQEIAEKEKVSQSTLYRWIKLYDESGLVSALVGKKRTGGSGKSRLTRVQEDIIIDKINSVYLNSNRKSITKTIREIELECHNLSIKPPHPNTIRNRIKSIKDEELIRKRYGIYDARTKHDAIKGKFPGADYPLSVIQIDHTPVDIILVDEINRKPLRRPWLTLAIDVYSRMVTGFYLSFESPSFLSVGMCIADSILPKEIWLERMGIDVDWPCWGIMDKIHVDNAKEFRSNMMQNACLNYGIDLEFRPVAEPHYGGHVERLLGTFAKEIHNLPGTTFSNVAERKKYESEKNSSFTINEFELWLAVYITKIYHKRIHSSINQTPVDKYNNGIVGTANSIGRGIPPRIHDERKVKLDFMPYVERTIQEYGVVIDHIYYYSDILKPYIHETIGKKPAKFIFKRDPRDISTIYFYDKKIDEYFDIPYRDTSLPPISIWEYREVVKKLKAARISVDETSIFSAYRELNEIEANAIKATKLKRSNYSKIQAPKIEKEIKVEAEEDNSFLKPFDDIDDEAFDPKARDFVETATIEQKIKVTRTFKWIGYPAAQKIIKTMDDYLQFPKRARMPNLLLIGDSNNGKTAILNKFNEQYPSYIEPKTTKVINPIILIQAPPEPDERRFYNAILEKVFAPTKTTEKVDSRFSRVKNTLKDLDVKLLIIDEIHHLLAGSMSKQRNFLNVIKHLANELQIPLVCAGTNVAYHALNSDKQLSNRFNPKVLPRWEYNDDYKRLLLSFIKILPLKEESQLIESSIAKKILALSNGLIGEITEILELSTILALESGVEKITKSIIEKIEYIPPYERKKSFLA